VGDDDERCFEVVSGDEQGSWTLQQAVLKAKASLGEISSQLCDY